MPFNLNLKFVESSLSPATLGCKEKKQFLTYFIIYQLLNIKVEKKTKFPSTTSTQEFKNEESWKT